MTNNEWTFIDFSKIHSMLLQQRAEFLCESSDFKCFLLLISEEEYYHYCCGGKEISAQVCDWA